MNANQMLSMIARWIDTKEAQARGINDPAMLNLVYSHIADLKTVQSWIEKEVVDSAKIVAPQAPRGRLVVNLNAANKSEALAALDLLSTELKEIIYPTDEHVRKAVYVTNEGCVWGG